MRGFRASPQPAPGSAAAWRPSKGSSAQRHRPGGEQGVRPRPAARSVRADVARLSWVWSGAGRPGHGSGCGVAREAGEQGGGRSASCGGAEGRHHVEGACPGDGRPVDGKDCGAAGRADQEHVAAGLTGEVPVVGRCEPVVLNCSAVSAGGNRFGKSAAAVVVMRLGGQGGGRCAATSQGKHACGGRRDCRALQYQGRGRRDVHEMMSTAYRGRAPGLPPRGKNARPDGVGRQGIEP